MIGEVSDRRGRSFDRHRSEMCSVPVFDGSVSKTLKERRDNYDGG